MIRYCLKCSAMLSLWLMGCESNSREPLKTVDETRAPRLMPNPDGNFVLYVSNQSAARALVDIEIRIDGRLAVGGDFDAGDRHHHDVFIFQLEKGEHVIHAGSRKGSATVEKRFTIKNKHWGSISYFFSAGGKRGVRIDPVFTVRIESEPIYFR